MTESTLPKARREQRTEGGRTVVRAAAGPSLLGGALIAFGTLLAWASFASMLSVYSVDGIGAGPGLVTLPLGILVIGMGIGQLRGRDVRPRYLVLAGSAAFLVVALTAAVNELVPNPTRGVLLTHFMGHRPGIFVVAAGAVLTILAGVVLSRRGVLTVPTEDTP